MRINVFGAASESDASRRRSPVERAMDRCRALEAAMDRMLSVNPNQEFCVILDFRKPSPTFDEDDDDDNADIQQLLARLFGDVLPNLPSREATISFFNVHDYSKYISMLSDSLLANDRPDRRLVTITFFHSELDPQAAGVLSSLLRRDGPVERLYLSNCTVGTDHLKCLCDGLEGNRRLLHLSIYFRQGEAAKIERDTIARAVDGSSSLTELTMYGARWTEDAIRAFWFHMRANDRLERLHILAIDERHRDTYAELMRDTLSRYNWTLRHIFIEDPATDRERELPDANATIRSVVAALEDRAYHVANMTVWPRLMGHVSSKPTLLYRLLRRGNLDAWSDHVAASVANAAVEGSRRAATTSRLERGGRRPRPRPWALC